MRKKNIFEDGLFVPRMVFAIALCVVGSWMAMITFAGPAPKFGAKLTVRNAGQTNTKASPSAPASMNGPTTNLSNGITFDHSTWNDPVRMVGEPDIALDGNDGIYVSGP